MKKYLVDSDILIYFLKGKQEVVEKLSHIPMDDLYISRINYTELIYGAYNSAKINQNLKVIQPFLDSFKVLEFTQTSSLIFAKEKARLKKNGNIIADMDLMIANMHHTTLVTTFYQQRKCANYHRLTHTLARE